MQAYLISQLIKLLVSQFTPELLKKFLEMTFDFAENYVLGTKSTVDDKVVFAITGALRELMGMSDND